MPHYSLIKAPGKYWKRQAIDGNVGGRIPHRDAKEYIPVFVMMKDDMTKKVLASIGGAPAEWVSHTLSARWITTKEKELEEKYKNQSL